MKPLTPMILETSTANAVGSLLDLSGKMATRFSPVRDGQKADAEAINSDWSVVGKDIYSSMSKLNEE